MDLQGIEEFEISDDDCADLEVSEEGKIEEPAGVIEEEKKADEAEGAIGPETVYVRVTVNIIRTRPLEGDDGEKSGKLEITEQ